MVVNIESFNFLHFTLLFTWCTGLLYDVLILVAVTLPNRESITCSTAADSNIGYLPGIENLFSGPHPSSAKSGKHHSVIDADSNALMYGFHGLHSATSCIKRLDSTSTPRAGLHHSHRPLSEQPPLPTNSILTLSANFQGLVHPINQPLKIPSYNKPKVLVIIHFVSDINMNSAANQYPRPPRTSLMLFLHALLFSLLATSTLAIPVPGSSSSRPSQVLDEEPIKGSAKPSRADGLWFRRGSYLVSENHSFYLSRD